MPNKDAGRRAGQHAARRGRPSSPMAVAGAKVRVPAAVPTGPVTEVILRVQAPFVTLAEAAGREPGLAAKIVRDALELVRRNPMLNECTPESFIGAMVGCLETGLRPSGFGQVYFEPVANAAAGTSEVQFLLGYRGLRDLAYATGMFAAVAAETVYTEDEFAIELGDTHRVRHVPAPFAQPRGVVAGYYAVGHYTGGAIITCRPLSAAAMAQHRPAPAGDERRSTDSEELAHKVMLRQLCDVLPGIEGTALALAMQWDGRVLNSASTTAAHAQAHGFDITDSGVDTG